MGGRGDTNNFKCFMRVTGFQQGFVYLKEINFRYLKTQVSSYIHKNLHIQRREKYLKQMFWSSHSFGLDLD